MAGGQDHVVFGDDLKALHGLLADFASVVRDPDGLASDALRTEVARDAHPVGQLALVQLSGDVGELVGGVDGGQPDDLVAHPARNVHGDGVEAADRVVQHEAAIGVKAGEHLTDEGSPRGRPRVVALDDEARHPGLHRMLCKNDVVELARQHVGRRVDVHVIGALQQPLDSVLVWRGQW